MNPNLRICLEIGKTRRLGPLRAVAVLVFAYLLEEMIKHGRESVTDKTLTGTRKFAGIGLLAP